MLVEIFSDVVCPWCYIGKARFELALADVGAEVSDLTVVYRPFQLDPSAPITPEPVLAAYTKKFGSEQQALSIMADITRTAAADGLTFHLDRVQRVNTFDAHRVLVWTMRHRGVAAQHLVKGELLGRYFERGANIADPQELVDVVAAVGVDVTGLREMLSSDDLIDDVRDELSDAHRRGISAVPTYVIDDNWAIPGAQSPAMFAKALRTLAGRA